MYSEIHTKMCTRNKRIKISVKMNLKHHRVHIIKYLHTWFCCVHSHHALGIELKCIGLHGTQNTNLACNHHSACNSICLTLSTLSIVVGLMVDRCSFKNYDRREVKFDTQITNRLNHSQLTMTNSPNAGASCLKLKWLNKKKNKKNQSPSIKAAKANNSL